MKDSRKARVMVAVLVVCIGCVHPYVVKGSPRTIREIQYTASPDGTSPYHGKVIDCAGGVVIAKTAGGKPRLVLEDPNALDGWGGIQVKGWASDVFAAVGVGDWVSFRQIFVEDYRGTTFLQYLDKNTDGSKPTLTVVRLGQGLPRPVVVDVNQIRAPTYRLQDDAWIVTDHRAERFESMLVQIRNVVVLDQGLGKAQDNYELQSFREPNDATPLCWASDYLNSDRPKTGLYVPEIQVGRRFRAVTGVLEQYTSLVDGFDYYQLLTLSKESVVGLCPADLNQDGRVDLRDYRLFVEQLLTPAAPAPSKACRAADLNQDGKVDVTDLDLFNAAWQKADTNGDGTVDERDLDL